MATTHPSLTDEPDSPVYRLSPRYLAGVTEDGPALIMDSLEVAGWTCWPDSAGHGHAFDATHRLALQFMPSDPVIHVPEADHVLWRLWARPGRFDTETWSAQFTDHTPHEILLPLIAAVAADPDAAIAPASREAVRAEGAAALQPLFTTGWRTGPTSSALSVQDPDQRARIVHIPGSGQEINNDIWGIEVRPHSDATPLWTAGLHATLPLHLLHTLCAAIADPAPVQRCHYPDEVDGHVTLTPVA